VPEVRSLCGSCGLGWVATGMLTAPLCPVPGPEQPLQLRDTGHRARREVGLAVVSAVGVSSSP